MTLTEFLSRLEGVKGRGGQYMAKCPAHGDNKPSLSVGLGKDNRILLKCHAGCSTEDILDALGLQMKDLFVEVKPNEVFPDYGSRKGKDHGPVVATYDYRDDNGNLLYQKLRYADKHFTQRQPDKRHGWIYSRNGIPHRLYVAGKLEGAVFVAEGEKDANTLHEIGLDAASGEDGAGPGKWRKEYTEQLKGLHVCVLQDNDQVGKDYAAETCNALHGVAASVRLLDLSKVWPEIPEHGDVTDMVKELGAHKAAELIGQLSLETPEWIPTATPAEAKADELLSLFKPLEDFPEEEARWLVPGWIPEGQISVIAADGGIGKTTLWCHIIAALSNGRTCILDPPGYTREPMRITFLTTEDSIRKKLRKKLRLAGANMKNIITPDFVSDRSGLLRVLKFGTPEMDKVLRYLRPALCVFDPVQGFTPPKVNMGSRNEMRDCLAPLISIGEDINTTALIVCHTNKRPKASGRDRIADSADLWDIARSVMMAGFTEEQGVRYLSNEKNNYGPLQETILFTIDADGQIHKAGTSWKRDREYIQGAEYAKSAPMREDCKAFILKTLNEAGGVLPTAELDKKVTTAGYSFSAVKRAKASLKAEKKVRMFQTGSTRKGDNVWHIQSLAAPADDFVELPEDMPIPFDNYSSRQTVLSGIE